MTIIGAVSKLFSAQGESDKDHPATQGAFGKLLSKGPMHGASLARQTETIKYLKATAGQSGESASGDATLEGKPCKWREFGWPDEARQDECSWQRVSAAGVSGEHPGRSYAAEAAFFRTCGCPDRHVAADVAALPARPN